jgi:hypothetical protein
VPGLDVSPARFHVVTEYQLDLTDETWNIEELSSTFEYEPWLVVEAELGAGGPFEMIQDGIEDVTAADDPEAAFDEVFGSWIGHWKEKFDELDGRAVPDEDREAILDLLVGEVNYPTLNAFGVLRVGLVHELGLEPVRVGGESAAQCHSSRLQGKLTVARPSRRLLAPTDIPHPDILRGVIVCVRFRPALHTLEVVASRAILVCRKSTLGAPLRRVRRPHLLYRDSFCFGFVLHLLVQRSERPLVPPRRSRPIADVGQILERYHVTLVSERFVHDGVRRPVEYVADVSQFSATRLFERPVGASRSGPL